MTFKRIVAVAVAAVLLTAGAYAGWLRHRAGRAVSIAPHGGYPVGRATHELADRSRTDELAPTGGNPRVLSIFLWYPAAARRGAESAYAPGPWAGLHKFGWAQTSFAAIRTGTFDDAPVAAGPFPIVVLMPGLGFAAPQYATIAAGLAARGYLVAGVTPTYSANLSVVGGRAVPATAAGDPSELDGPVGDRLVTVWAADARFAAYEAGVLLGAHADRNRIAYVGHSFGGAAAIEACRTDEYCVGAADLDGTPFGPAVSAGLRHPLLLMSSDRNGAATDPATQKVFAASPSAWGYTIDGGRHFDFSDYGAYWLAAPVRRILPVGSARVLPAVNEYLPKFLDMAVRGGPWRPPGIAGVRPAEMLSR